MRTALVAGASGLVGSALVSQLLLSPQYSRVIILVRKKFYPDHPKLIQQEVNFEQLEDLQLNFKVTDAYCTLGTTISKAGSRAAFIKVDHDYVCSFAGLALNFGASRCVVVSSMGANSSSSIFYNKVKGLAEEDLKKAGFPRLVIVRPSLLLGPRTEKRAGEKFAAWFMKVLDFMIPPKYKAIHVNKVAAKMIESSQSDEPGIFILESDKLH
jgi:uncharacterized protein YbjT (DUF2867 family)